MKKRNSLQIFLLIIIFSLTACVKLNKKNVDTPPTDHKVDFGIFTNANLQSASFIKDSVLDLKVDKIALKVNWANVETSPGVYNWTSLDKKIDILRQETNADVFLRVLIYGQAEEKDPDTLYWYCDPNHLQPFSCLIKSEYEQNFKNFISELTQRYKGKIARLQFGNEWDSSWHFIGTAEDYVKYTNWVYEITKKNSPSTKVSLGGITHNPLKFFALCDDDFQPHLLTSFTDIITGQNVSNKIPEYCTDADGSKRAKQARVEYVFAHAKYDTADFHLYDDTENWDEYLTAMNYLLEKNGRKEVSLVITEFGGPKTESKVHDASDETYQAQELRKYIKKILTFDVEEAYFYQFIQVHGAPHNFSGLAKYVNGRPAIKKPTYEVFKHRYELN